MCGACQTSVDTVFAEMSTSDVGELLGVACTMLSTCQSLRTVGVGQLSRLDCQQIVRLAVAALTDEATRRQRAEANLRRQDEALRRSVFPLAFSR